MQLCEQLQQNEQAMVILARSSEISKKHVGDVIVALNKMVETAPRAEVIKDRLRKTHALCVCMEPEVKDVIAMLLHVAHSNYKASLKSFEEWYYPKKGEMYFRWMLEAFRNAPSDPQREKKRISRSEEIDRYIMMRVCDSMYLSLPRPLKRRGTADTSSLLSAYELAQKSYSDVRGWMGEPSLVHHIAIASILAEAGLDVYIVAAALLHDVITRTSCTAQDVRAKCNLRVVKCVEAAVKVQADLDALQGHGVQSKQYRELVAAISNDPTMTAALCIKAADRIHQLRMMQKLPRELCPNREETTHYLPLLRELRLNYLANEIEDLEWRANDPTAYWKTTDRYKENLRRNAASAKAIRDDLDMCVDHGTLGLYAAAENNVKELNIDISEYRYLSLEVRNFAKADAGQPRADLSDVPLCDFDIAVEPAEKVDIFLPLFVKAYMSRYNTMQRTVVDYTIDPFGRYILMVEDERGCLFRLCVSSRVSRELCRMGTQVTVLSDDAVTKEATQSVGETIDVRLRNGKNLTLPKGACVLDVAFAIHPQLGLAAKGATVNGCKAKLVDKLRDNDSVLIIADTYRKDGVTKKFVPHVRVDWMLSVVTDKARKAIVKWCHDNYESDDPADETDALDDDAGNAINATIAVLKDVEEFESLDDLPDL